MKMLTVQILKNFVSNAKINLEKVQSMKEEFFRCMAKCYPQTNPEEELKELASKAKEDGDSYIIKVDKTTLERMPLFHFVAKATAGKSCVPRGANWKLTLDDGTCIKLNGFIPENVPSRAAQVHCQKIL